MACSDCSAGQRHASQALSEKVFDAVESVVLAEADFRFTLMFYPIVAWRNGPLFLGPGTPGDSPGDSPGKFHEISSHFQRQRDFFGYSQHWYSHEIHEPSAWDWETTLAS